MVKQATSGLPSGVPRSFYAECTQQVRTAYSDMAAQHDPKIGNDAVTFGIGVSRSVWFRLAQRFTGDQAVKIHRPDGSFELILAGNTFKPCKLGDTALDNVWTSFPYNADATARMAVTNVAQLHIGVIGAPINYVLGHFGNPQTGFAMLYLCVPVSDRSGNIVSWSTAIRIDNLGRSGSTARIVGPKPLPRPPVRLRDEPLTATGTEGDSSPAGDA